MNRLFLLCIAVALTPCICPAVWSQDDAGPSAESQMPFFGGKQAPEQDTQNAPGGQAPPGMVQPDAVMGRQRRPLQTNNLIFRRFDTNGDGRLDANEQANMDAYMQQRKAATDAAREAAAAPPEDDPNARVFRQAAPPDSAGGGYVRPHDPTAPAVPMFNRSQGIPRNFVQQFDSNHDMLLDENEQGQLGRALMAKPGMVQAFDGNHDGVLDGAEQARLGDYINQVTGARTRAARQQGWGSTPSQQMQMQMQPRRAAAPAPPANNQEPQPEPDSGLPSAPPPAAQPDSSGF